LNFEFIVFAATIDFLRRIPSYIRTTDDLLPAVIFSGLEISGNIVIGGMPHESHPPYLFEGLIKDLSVWNTPLSLEQVGDIFSILYF
jgi:hypothetical protein